MKCNNCGKENTSGVRFCINCGASMEQPVIYDNTQSGLTNSNNASIRPKMPKKKRILIAIVSIIGGLIVIIGIGNAFSGGGSSGYVNSGAFSADSGETQNEISYEDTDDITDYESILYSDIKESATLLYPAENSEWEYEVYQDNTGIYDKYVVIKSCKSDSGIKDIEIPSEIEGCPVICLGESVFKNYDLIRIVIPNGVICVGENCFDGCIFATQISLPNSLTEVESGAFYDTTPNKIELPKGLVRIGSSAFKFNSWEYDENREWVVDEDGKHVERERIDEVIIPASVKVIYDTGVAAKKVVVLSRDVDLTPTYDDDGLWADTVCGYKGSTAAAYCAEYDIPFEPLD